MPEDNDALIRRELISNAGTQLGKVVNETFSSVESQSEQARLILEKIYSLHQSVSSIHEATSSIEQTSLSLENKSESSVAGIETVTQKLEELELRFEPIFKSIETINNIADSTKLLAVNAGIQAAKAGQAGASFAVVAKEIQELSTTTQRTNSQMTQHIDELKKTMTGLSASLGTTVSALSEMKTDSQSNRNEVNRVVGDTMELSQQMNETQASSMKIEATTKDLVESFDEVSTINKTFDAILALMTKKQILNSKMDVLAPFEAIAETTGFMDETRFRSNEDEYVLSENEILISQTDTKGVISYGNRTFYRIAEFEKMQMDGKPHNIIRHPDMPKSAFKHLWDTLKQGDLWQGIVLNKGAKGRVYWVRAIVFPVYEGNSLTGYLSVRSKPSQQEIDRAKIAYRKLP